MNRPKSGPNDSSSDDLERARSASRRLRGSAPATSSSADPGYVTFAPGPGSPQLAAPSRGSPFAPRPPLVAPLAARPAPPPPVPPAPVPPAPRPSSVPLMTRREPLKAPSAGFGADSWNKLLDACVAVTGAEAALLMDPHGLIITSRGPRQGDELEVVGARLMVAFEQADRIDGQRSTLSMAFELPRGTVQGLRLIQPDGVLTLGLIVPGGLSAERQNRLVSLIAAAE